MRSINGIEVIRPFHLEIITEVLSERVLDGVQHIIKHALTRRIDLVVITFTLKHTCSQETASPVVGVCTTDIRGRVISNHGDVLRQTFFAVEDGHPFGQDLVGVEVCGTFWFAVDHAVEFDAREGFVHGFEADAECALGHARLEVFGWTEQIALREVDGDALRDGVFGYRVQTAVL